MKNLFCRWLWLVLLDLSVAFASCGQLNKQTAPQEPSAQSEAHFDSTQIATFLLSYPKLIHYENELRAFYRKRNFTYVWYQDHKLIEQVGTLQNRLRNLEEDGVYKKLSYLTILDSIVQESNGNLKPNTQLELLLTSEYFVFSNLVWNGMIPSVSKTNNWLLPRKKVSYDLYLDSLLQALDSNSTEFKAPVYRQYELLKAALKKYTKLDSADMWKPISSSSEVRSRLIQLGDFTDTLRDSIDTLALQSAIVGFQERHGLRPNGLLDKATLDELNVPLKSRIRQIVVNMERSRWLPITTVGTYVAINIPEFQMHVYRADSLLWSSNAVVGRVANATTLFYGEINQVVFSPYWNVPESIVRKEILPRIKKDEEYLSKHNMEIVGQRNGLPVIRQRPGSSNALGLVKFLFPNSYSIYLHDSPQKSLFNEYDRAFSHGCIRIREPEKLAALLLNTDKKWDNNSIYVAMHSGREKVVPISRKVPVYIVYMTAFIDRKNQLNFRKDIYQLDDRLASTIISGESSY